MTVHLHVGSSITIYGKYSIIKAYKYVCSFLVPSRLTEVDN